MEQIKRLQKRYGSMAMFLALVAGIGLLLLGYKPVGKGVLLGTIFSIINFILMAESLPSRIGTTRKKATVFSFLWIVARYGLLAIPLFLSMKMEQFNLWATVVGLFMIQMVILADSFISQVYFSTQKKNSTENLLWKN
ncbi:MAG: ATP synthase subunit I [Desulfobacterales bacterium]